MKGVLFLTGFDLKKVFNKRIILGLAAVLVIVILALVMSKLISGDGGKLPVITGSPDVLQPQTTADTTTQAQTDQHGSTVEPPVTQSTTSGDMTVGSTADTTAEPPPAYTRREGVYTFLVVGMDQQQVLTDVLMLVTYDTVKSTMDVLQIPRDTYSNYLCGGSTSSIHNINLAYNRGRATGIGGIVGLEEEVKHLVGFGVDFYIQVNMNGFKKIINKIGGVKFDLPIDMDYDDASQDLHIHLKKGLQTFNGTDALNLLRFRSGYYNADIGRVEMRSKFLKAAASQLLSGSNAAKAVELAGTLADNTNTDLTLSELQAFAKTAIGLNIANVNFYTLPGTGSSGSPYWWPYENALLKMINEHFNPYNEPITYIDVVRNQYNQGK